MANKGKDDFTEKKMSYKVGDITVTGQIDSYNILNGIIDDYKTASVTKVKFGDFSDWKLQGMVYSWLLTRNNFPVSRCRFIALLKDHSKTDAMRDREYPKNPVYLYEFPVTLPELFKIGMYINTKIEEYKRCKSLKDDDIPPCTPKERWEKPPKFAVMKTGGKRAVRLFDNKGDADLLAESKGTGHYVEHRQGESIKCQSYCLCNRFCNYYQEMVNRTKSELSEEAAAA
jgi:hypothetical protein